MIQDIHFKTIFKTKIADTITPVGLYLRFRDKFANTLLLESSDYHSKEESFSFICIEPVISIQAKNHFLSFSHREEELVKEELAKEEKDELGEPPDNNEREELQEIVFDLDKLLEFV